MSPKAEASSGGVGVKGACWEPPCCCDLDCWEGEGEGEGGGVVLAIAVSLGNSSSSSSFSPPSSMLRIPLSLPMLLDKCKGVVGDLKIEGEDSSGFRSIGVCNCTTNVFAGDTIHKLIITAKARIVVIAKRGI